MSTERAQVMSLQDIDAELRAAWQRFATELMPGQPRDVVQWRFSTLGLFPEPGWRWLTAGEALAVQQHDVQLLHGTLQRVRACAHACWGQVGSDGLHPSGEDHCAAVTPALHALALGPQYAAAVFHGRRPLSTRGHAARRHAANLLVLLHHPDWPHGAKALTAARAAVEGRAGNAADRAFVGTLLALVTADRTSLAQCLPAFAAAYTRSDWGRHLPRRQPIVVANLLALARRHQPAAVVDPLSQTLLAPERAALWRAHAQALSDGRLAPLVLGAELAFLDVVPGSPAP